MTTWDRASFEEQLIADLRAHDGVVTAGPLKGNRLLIMWSTGSTSGLSRRSILTYSRDGDAWVVAASNSGAPVDSKWVGNVRANPEVTLEVANETFQARAAIAEGAERDRLWASHVAALPRFADYPKTSGRVIPMITLTRIPG